MDEDAIRNAGMIDGLAAERLHQLLRPRARRRAVAIDEDSEAGRLDGGHADLIANELGMDFPGPREERRRSPIALKPTDLAVPPSKMARTSAPLSAVSTAPSAPNIFRPFQGAGLWLAEIWMHPRGMEVADGNAARRRRGNANVGHRAARREQPRDDGMAQHVAAGPAVARYDNPAAAEKGARGRGKGSRRLRNQALTDDAANARDGNDQVRRRLLGLIGEV